MKKIEKCKSFIAIFLLAIMVVSMLSVESYAANTYDRDGYRVSSNKGYRSYTEGSGYDEKGNGLNIGVEAYLGTGPSRSVSRAADVKYGRGFISVYSGYTSVRLDAFHRFCKGHNIDSNYVIWQQN